MTLTAANSPYKVVESIWIPQGMQLDIQPGVEMRFQAGQGIYVAGTIITNGTSASPVQFIKDPDDLSSNNWAGIIIRRAS